MTDVAAVDARLKGLDLPRLAVSSPLALAVMAKIVDAPGGPERWVLWPHQREILRALLDQRRIVILKARQLGVTRVLALYALWYALANAGTNSLIVSIGKREASKVKRHIRDLFFSVPDAVRSAFSVGTDNETTFEILRAGGMASVVQSLPSSDAAGRGETSNLLIMDEAAHWEHADERMAALLPTAADVGQVVMSSTANGAGGRYHTTWAGAPENSWHPIFVPADSRPDRSAEWVRVEREQLEGLGPQEYPMSPGEAFLASGRCAFQVPALQDYLENICRPAIGRFSVLRDARSVYAERDERGPWRIWRFREPGRSYVITGDPCGGGGGKDYAAMAVYDRDSWEQVAAYHGRPEPDEFARDMIRAGWLYKDQEGRPALLVPEANNHGAAVIAIMRERHYPHLWTFRSLSQRRDIRQVEFGWTTTTKSRKLALAALKEGVRERSLIIRDSAAIGEMLRFVVKVTANGTEREEADDGSNDDRVMAHAIAAVVLQRKVAGVFRPERFLSDPVIDEAPLDETYEPRVSAVTGY